jgi:tetratricopeptide (TPR) repeat protein
LNKDLAAAGKAFTKALELDPSYTDARYNQALIFALEGKVDEAMEQLERVLQEDPELGLAHYIYGRLNLAKQDLEGGLTALQRAVELLPDNGDVWFTLAQAQEMAVDLDAARTSFCKAKQLGLAAAESRCP